jgi:hypothetical protein
LDAEDVVRRSGGGDGEGGRGTESLTGWLRRATSQAHAPDKQTRRCGHRISIRNSD